MARQNNLAYDLDMYKPEANKPEKIKMVQQKAPAVKKQRKSELVLLCLLTVCVAAFMVFSRVSLNEATSELNSARQELTVVTTEQNRLNRLVDMKMSLANIEEYATTNLGMIKPDTSQIHYIALSETNVIRVKDNAFSMPEFLSAAIDKIASYFN